MPRKRNRKPSPPEDTRLKPGQSGNPNGRPRKSRARRPDESPVQMLLSEPITTDNGDTISMEDGCRLRLLEQALAGDRKALRTVTGRVLKRERARRKLARQRAPEPRCEFRFVQADQRAADDAMLVLRIAEEVNPHAEFNPDFPLAEDEPRHLRLNPKVVQKALSRRRGGERLSDIDLNLIKKLTTRADEVRWPKGRK